MLPDRFLLFVYNLDKGSVADIKDYLYSSQPAKTPQCNLCALISSPVGIKKGWKRFTSEIGIPVKYLFRDEFSHEFSLPKSPSPAVFIQIGGSTILLVNSDDLNYCKNTDELIDLVKKRIQKYL
jgi:hypothetical protein